MQKILAYMIACTLLLSANFVIAEATEQNALPEYVYPGEDPIEGAVANYISENAPEYWDDSIISVVIPAPVILKTNSVDDDHVDVYGNFWRMRYKLEGCTLICISGGAAAGIMHLEMIDQVWTVASIETAGDGTDYPKDIIRFCNGDKDLEKAYFSATDVQHDPLKTIRGNFIRDYVEANQLLIDSYQDPYWDAVPLFE